MTVFIILSVWLITIASIGMGVVLSFIIKDPKLFEKSKARIISMTKKSSAGIVTRREDDEIEKVKRRVEEGDDEFAKLLKSKGVKPKDD